MDWIVVLISLLSLANGMDFRRRCLLFQGKCVPHCPPQMHPYHTRCDRDTISQRTCSHPEQYVLGYTCGWSRCDCNGDLVLTEQGYCVNYRECTSPMKNRKQRRKNKKRPYSLSKRIKLPDVEEIPYNQ